VTGGEGTEWYVVAACGKRGGVSSLSTGEAADSCSW